MTKVNERAVVPPVGPPQRRQMAAVLDREGVVSADLIGSQARGAAGSLSDIDVAVWLDPALDRAARGELRILLASELTSALSTEEIDVLVLNDAPPLVTHRATGEGVRLVTRDELARVRLESDALLVYLDTAPLREELDRGVRRRLEEGRFGRR